MTIEGNEPMMKNGRYVLAPMPIPTAIVFTIKHGELASIEEVGIDVTPTAEEVIFIEITDIPEYVFKPLCEGIKRITAERREREASRESLLISRMKRLEAALA